MYDLNLKLRIHEISFYGKQTKIDHLLEFHTIDFVFSQLNTTSCRHCSVEIDVDLPETIIKKYYYIIFKRRTLE